MAPSDHHRWVALGLALTLPLACTGQIETAGPTLGSSTQSPGDPTRPGGTGSPGNPNNPGGTAGSSGGQGEGSLALGTTTRLARLSHPQWENAVRDLLRLDDRTGLSSAFPPDPTTRFDTDVELKNVSSLHWAAYQTAAEEVAQQVAKNPQKLAKIVPSDLPAAGSERARAFVKSFGRRAFRRPLSDEEVTAFAGLFEQGSSLLGGDALAAGVELTLRAMLQSPHFLYRVELSTEATSERVWLSGHEVASRLSFALWNSMPSDELLAAADAGKLGTAAEVEAWAKTMVDDPRAAEVLASFHGQLLDVSSYGSGVKSSTVYPQFTDDLRPLLREEASLFFSNVMAKEHGGLRELLTSNVTHVNDKLAPIYGLAGTFGPEMKRVELDPKKRAGVLTQAGFLAKNGGLVQSDPIHRGVSIQLRLLCRTLTAPNMIPPLPEIKPGQTNRELVHDHTKACGGSCHNEFINPAGFAFEHFDSIGAWRDQDNGKPVDSADTLTIDDKEVSFQDAPGLMAALAGSQEAHDCYARNWAEYALGRPVADGEQGWVKAQLAATSRQGASAAELLIKLASSDLVRARPASEEKAP